jgi:hypothetical protein
MKHTLRKVKKCLKDRLCLAVGKVCKFEPEENLLIFGDPRGGSTWIAEVISLLPSTAVTTALMADQADCRRRDS